MDTQFFCGDCGSHHGEPAEALLGHLVICLDCAMHRESFAVGSFAIVAMPDASLAA